MEQGTFTRINKGGNPKMPGSGKTCFEFEGKTFCEVPSVVKNTSPSPRMPEVVQFGLICFVAVLIAVVIAALAKGAFKNEDSGG